MFKLAKWLWTMAENRARERILADIHARRSYHIAQSEIVYLKERYEPETKDDEDMLMRDLMLPRFTPKEHGAIIRVLDEILAQNRRVTGVKEQDE